MEKNREDSLRSKVDEAGLEPNIINHMKYRLMPTKYTAPKRGEGYRKAWETYGTVYSCAYPDFWKSIGPEALKLGNIFCSVVDNAIIRGYNPNMKWQLPKCLTRNDEHCEHIGKTLEK
jgi:hypothetical protein